MTIGIIDAGAISTSFTHRLAQTGIAAILSNSRGPDSLADLCGWLSNEAFAEIERIGFFGVDLRLLNEGDRVINVPVIP